jgi:hypothetical protein
MHVACMLRRAAVCRPVSCPFSLLFWAPRRPSKYGPVAMAAGLAISFFVVGYRYGFHEAVDTEAMFFRMFDELRASKVIP